MRLVIEWQQPETKLTPAVGLDTLSLLSLQMGGRNFLVLELVDFGIRNPGDDLVWSASIATPNLPLHELRAGC